jgi:hypothetical protein
MDYKHDPRAALFALITGQPESKRSKVFPLLTLKIFLV